MLRTLRIALVITALALAHLGCPGNVHAQQNKAEQELIQIERDWCTAAMKKDATSLARILADDYTAVGSRGTPSTKAEELANLKGADSTTTCVDTNFKVRIYGDAAVVTGLATRAGTYKGVAFKDRQFLWTDTFIKKDGRWQCVASQATVVATQQK